MHLSVRCPCLLVHHEAAAAVAIARVQSSAGQAMPRLANAIAALWCLVPCQCKHPRALLQCCKLLVSAEEVQGGAGKVQRGGGGAGGCQCGLLSPMAKRSLGAPKKATNTR